jgi:hypothetical protein
VSNCFNHAHACPLVLKKLKEPASAPRISTELALLNYKGKHAQIKNNYFCKPNIMINSPEVCFDITRQHAQVGHKYINIFSYKNHLGRFYIIGKQFI